MMAFTFKAIRMHSGYNYKSYALMALTFELIYAITTFNSAGNASGAGDSYK
jgi:hypothetical protein